MREPPITADADISVQAQVPSKGISLQRIFTSRSIAFTESQPIRYSHART
jgi:hypothetical protein